jgi:hypothetical protein
MWQTRTIYCLNLSFFFALQYAMCTAQSSIFMEATRFYSQDFLLKALGFNFWTYHRVLGSILSSLVRAQNNGGIKCHVLDQLDADGTEIEFCLKVPLAFMISNVKGHDVLCAWYHTRNTKMLSRNCNCTMDEMQTTTKLQKNGITRHSLHSISRPAKTQLDMKLPT